MKRFLFLICFLLTASLSVCAQDKFTDRPKLVVGIVVDQMRWDYLSRYYDQLPEGGLKRLIKQGYSCNNCLINYVPTVTAIGHTSIYTGTTPAYHGICGNSFYVDGKAVGCVADDNYQTVGSDTKKGQSSPHLLRTVGTPRRRSELSIMSSCIRVKEWKSSSASAGSIMSLLMLSLNRLNVVRHSLGLRRLPPTASIYSNGS